jgi:MFS superfamily sulfate permease-like transporter
MGNNENLHEKLIDIELAKSDNNSKVRKFLPAAVLVASMYYSFFLGLGLALGYLGAKLYAKLFIDKGRVDSIYIDFTENWKIHMHHWILGAIFLLIVWFIDYFYLPSFFVGAVIGIIAHDIYDYNDWHKVLVKNEAK